MPAKKVSGTESRQDKHGRGRANAADAGEHTEQYALVLGVEAVQRPCVLANLHLHRQTHLVGAAGSTLFVKGCVGVERYVYAVAYSTALDDYGSGSKLNYFSFYILEHGEREVKLRV